MNERTYTIKVACVSVTQRENDCIVVIPGKYNLMHNFVTLPSNLVIRINSNELPRIANNKFNFKLINGRWYHQIAHYTYNMLEPMPDNTTMTIHATVSEHDPIFVKLLSNAGMNSHIERPRGFRTKYKKELSLLDNAAEKSVVALSKLVRDKQ